MRTSQCFCVTGVLLCLVLHAAFAAPETDATGSLWWVYIGTYTGGDSEGIYLLHFDAESGLLEKKGLACAVENPSFLALHPSKPLLYAVGQMRDADGQVGGAVSAIAINPGDGRLVLLNTQSSVGRGPCHVAVDPSGRHVAVANYSGGSVAVLPILEDGRLGEAACHIQHEGSSVHPQRQQGPFAHSVTFDAAGRFLFAADLGADKIFVYRFDAERGVLEPNDPPSATLAPGAGPRHFAFHPTGRFAFTVNELDNTVTAFSYDATMGRLDTLQSIGTLPEDFAEQNTTAEIRVNHSGRFLYASNRGHDSIAAFAIDQETGRLTALGQTPTGGRTPRNFNLDPSGRFLIAANQATNNVVVFRIDQDNGTLEAAGQEVAVPTPVCVLFVKPVKQGR